MSGGGALPARAAPPAAALPAGAPPRLRLASGSPRRRELLQAAGFTCEICVPGCDEPWRGPPHTRAACALARHKLEHVLRRFPADDPQLTLAADTVVVVDGAPLGKPRDPAHHAEMLRALAGRTQQVVTGVAVACGRRRGQRAVVTQVTFRQLSEADIARYLAAGEAGDKAGGWALQGLGAALVARLVGSPSNVIGLPVAEALALLARVGGRG